MTGNFLPFNRLALLLIALVMVESCTQEGNGKAHNVSAKKVYKGLLDVDADAGLEPVLRQQKEVFEFLYDSVKLNINYTNEQAMLDDFGKHKAQVIIFSRLLDETEKEHLKTVDTMYTREIAVAYDAVALVGNRQFNDDSLDVAVLKQYFNPGVTSNKNPQLVFDNNGSSVVKYMLNYLGYKNHVSSNVYAVKSVQEVLDYVQKNKNAIGFIPFNFLSDADDDSVKQIYERIKVLSLCAKGADGKQIRVSANQSDIATGDYPLIRTINVIIPYHFDDSINWLFANFLLNGKGSKIFLRAGLIPVKRTEREINVNTNGLKGLNQ